MAVLSRSTGVSAEDLVAAVRVHLDRVHDAVRRLGCEPDAALEVVEASAIDLVQVVADRPESVTDAVGWWFARARALGLHAATRNPDDLPLGGGVLSVDDDQQVLAEALDQLPERERVALLLRDSYDLPAASVGAALGTDADGAMELVGRARLAFLPLVDDEPAPAAPAHQGGIGALARLGEGGPVAARDATTRRHALSCPACSEVTDAQQRAHLLLTGLTVVALPEADRTGLLDRLEEVAYGILPTSAGLRWAGEEEELYDDDEEPRLFSPLLVLFGLVLATLAGLGVGLLLSRDPGPAARLGSSGDVAPGVLASPPVQEPEVLVSPPVVQAPAPVTSVFLVPSPTPSPSPSPELPSPTPQTDRPTLTVDPSSGGNGAELQVTGTGWTPGSQVRLDYLDSFGRETGSRTTVMVDDNGEFSGELTAEDPSDLPGRHFVRATDGERTLQQPYDVEP